MLSWITFFCSFCVSYALAAFLESLSWEGSRIARLYASRRQQEPHLRP